MSDKIYIYIYISELWLSQILWSSWWNMVRMMMTLRKLTKNYPQAILVQWQLESLSGHYEFSVRISWSIVRDKLMAPDRNFSKYMQMNGFIQLHVVGYWCHEKAKCSAVDFCCFTFSEIQELFLLAVIGLFPREWREELCCIKYRCRFVVFFLCFGLKVSFIRLSACEYIHCQRYIGISKIRSCVLNIHKAFVMNFLCFCISH